MTAVVRLHGFINFLFCFCFQANNGKVFCVYILVFLYVFVVWCVKHAKTVCLLFLLWCLIFVPIYVIKKLNVLRGFFSRSTSEPTLPSNYRHEAQLGTNFLTAHSRRAKLPFSDHDLFTKHFVPSVFIFAQINVKCHFWRTRIWHDCGATL